ncbi:hypothetical protein AB0K18_06660 [Nonomuraea sp. NPDC049421]|jgi:hypothetical protein|uniref:Secreted protein n=1 Tax=Nonomuraea salmonea TaxID=46181 RepID=A0ABV5NTW6_9ACTN
MSAAIAVAAVGLSAAPASAASWHPYQAYKNYDTCVEVGKYAVAYGKSTKYKCDWDSPYWLLSLYY